MAQLQQTMLNIILLSFALIFTEVLSQPPPAIGDIRLVKYTIDPNLQDHYIVQIYYSDGTSEGSYGGVCADHSYATEAKVICNQLGYKYIRYSSREVSNSNVWFKRIDCSNGNASHILRCNAIVASDTERTTCGPNNYRLLVNCDFSQPLPRYDGQVTLCPVNNDSSTTRVSTSYGLVGIFYREYENSKGINQKDTQPLRGLEADTICRNLGFTGADPWSAERVEAVGGKYSFSNCFSNTGTNPPYKLHHGAWVTTDNIKCDGNQKCIGCCMHYPSRASCEGCDDKNNIVIGCVFDPSKILTDDGIGDRSKDCKLGENKNVAQCVQDNTIRDLRISLGFITAALILVIVACLCYAGYKKEWHKKFGLTSYEKMKDDNKKKEEDNKEGG